VTKAQRDINRTLRVLSYAHEIGNASKACLILGYPERHSTNGKEPMPNTAKRPL